MILVLLVVALFLLRWSVSSEGFEDGKGGAKDKLLIFKADWCGHCQRAAPEFEKLQQASPLRLSNGRHVDVEVMDADKDKEKLKSYDVRGFPSIFIQRGDSGERMEYPGERTYDAVIAFLEQMK